MNQTRLRLTAGTGVVARKSDELVFVPDGSPVLIEAFEAAPPNEGLDAVTRGAEEVGFDEVADFVAIDWSRGVRLAVFGSVEVVSDHRSLPRLSASGAGTWVERSIRQVDGELTIGVAVDDAVGPTDLRDGVAQAGGFALTCLPGSQRVELPAQERVAMGPGEPAPLSASSAERQPSELVAAPRESANAPAVEPVVQTASPSEEAPAVEPTPSPTAVDALAEEVLAGASGSSDVTAYRAAPDDVTIIPDSEMRSEIDDLVGRRGEGTDGGLPPLPPIPGSVVSRQLVFSDGAVEAIDRTLVLGRKPSFGVGQSEIDARLVQLDCSQVSSRHLEVRSDGSGVSVVDLGSSNGSFVLTTGDGQLVRLEANTPHRVDSGMIIQIGTKRFRVESTDA